MKKYERKVRYLPEKDLETAAVLIGSKQKKNRSLQPSQCGKERKVGMSPANLKQHTNLSNPLFWHKHTLKPIPSSPLHATPSISSLSSVIQLIKATMLAENMFLFNFQAYQHSMAVSQTCVRQLSHFYLLFTHLFYSICRYKTIYKKILYRNIAII